MQCQLEESRNEESRHLFLGYLRTGDDAHWPDSYLIPGHVDTAVLDDLAGFVRAPTGGNVLAATKDVLPH